MKTQGVWGPVNSAVGPSSMSVPSGIRSRSRSAVVSASWAHANASPGSPGTGVLNAYPVAGAPVSAPAGSADFALNTVDSSADQYAIGVKYHFSPFVSWYMVGSYLRNGPGAHYCLGASGHGYAVCGRDANNNVIAGNKAEAVTTGMTFDF